MSNLLSQLNDKQKAAVTQAEGPVLILAGAGSGKTRTLTFRVAYLIKEKGVSPKNILAVTFTNKAAGEMIDRIKKLLGLPQNIPPYSQYLPHIGTFHSICVRILRREIEKLGYNKNFVIYDEQDQRALIKKVVKDLDISTDQIKPTAILGAISGAKNNLIGPEEFRAEAGSYFEEIIANCYEKYDAYLKKADAVDFDDIIMLTVKIFRKFPKTLESYQELFRYIMVDEYQDTNQAQYVLLKLLAQKYRNLCVVGDDWQSIYSWRGADVQNILNFEKDYPEAKVITLEQNYRSTQTILDAAYCVISKNANRKDKKLWTEQRGGQLITSYEALDEKDEADFTAKEIKKLKKKMKLRLSDFAVLFRTNAQSRALEEAFMKWGIPYRIIGGVKFYQRKEIKDILAYLYFIKNPFDEVSFGRIINIPPRKIGAKTIQKILDSKKENQSILDRIGEIVFDQEPNQFLPKDKTKKLQQFFELIKKSQELSLKEPVSRLIEYVFSESGYEKMLLRDRESGETRRENVLELLTVAKKFDKEEEGLEIFLEEVALVSQTDRDLEKLDAVPLMTLHSAKGLEYEVVFIVGMEEGILPHSRSTLSEKEMEEERRLCYVGITRAKQKAYLLFTTSRSIYGSTQISIRSRFLEEIDDHLLEKISFEELAGTEKIDVGDYCQEAEFEETGWQKKLRSSKRFLRKNSGKKEAKKDKIRDGDQVDHPEFGKGVVISVEEDLATIAFAGKGIKKIAWKIAPIRKISL